MSTLTDTDEDASFTLGTRHILFQIGNATLICRLLEGEFLDYKTKGFYDNCIEKCNGRLKAIHFLMESIRQNRPVTEEELEETLPAFLNSKKDAK